MTTGAGQTQGPFLVSRHSSFDQPPAAGRQRVIRGWPACMSSCHTWKARVWSAIAGAQGTGACSRLSPPVSGPHGSRGHTYCTPPWACSVSSQSDATRKRVRACRTRCVHLGVGNRHPRPYMVHGVKMDTLGHSDTPAACIVLEGSGRAGPSVVVDAWRSERDGPSQHSLCTTTLRLKHHLAGDTNGSRIALSLSFSGTFKLSLGNRLCTRHVDKNGTPCVFKILKFSMNESKEKLVMTQQKK